MCRLHTQGRFSILVTRMMENSDNKTSSTTRLRQEIHLAELSPTYHLPESNLVLQIVL